MVNGGLSLRKTREIGQERRATGRTGRSRSSLPRQRCVTREEREAVLAIDGGLTGCGGNATAGIGRRIAACDSLPWTLLTRRR